VAPVRRTLDGAMVFAQAQTHPKEDTMATNHRSGVAQMRPWLIAAAALATLVTAAVLLHPMTTQAAPAGGTVVSTAKTGLGQVLVNSRGRTLYLFGADRNGKSACSGKCATFWPPLIANGASRAAGGAKTSMLGTIKRSDGRRQVTYNHHPLYTFVKDTKKGQTHGEGVSAFGAKWDAVSPAGAKVVPKPAGNGIPQHNGGDHDADNNGGPSDGDGNL
jgi:predicted lipoprotein with Yx(FWY)xxD motif